MFAFEIGSFDYLLKERQTNRSCMRHTRIGPAKIINIFFTDKSIPFDKQIKLATGMDV